MTTTTTVTNGRARKSLAEQIDRLDSILDGLSEALQGAVAAAVTEAVGVAVREAVRCVLAEVLHSPEFLERLRQVTAGNATATVPPAPRGPGRITRGLGRACAWARERAAQARQAAGDAASLLGQSVTHGRQYVQVLLPFRRQILLSAAVGTAAGVVAFYSTPALAAAAAWLGGFATALAVQGALLLRRWLLLAGVRGAEPLGGGREA